MQQWVIQKIRIDELENFFQEYPFHSKSVFPISPERIQSYIKNPRAKGSDYAIYFVEREKKVIAFRTVWADELRCENSVPIRFGWCSGNWVSPDFRRQGLSSFLLKEMYSDWDGMLMFTNYAPESEAGYLKTGMFQYKIERKGLRFYQNIDISELFEKRNVQGFKKWLLSVLNVAFAVRYKVKQVFFFKHKFNGIEVEEKTIPDQFDLDYSRSVFARAKNEFQWIFDYPWLLKGEEDKTYPFSWKVNDFEYRFVRIKNPVGLSASLLISNRNNWVKVLYWEGSLDSNVLLARWLVNYCSSNQIKILTVLDDQFAALVKKQRSTFVWSKQFDMNIYASFKVDCVDKPVYDGDGDYIFT